MQNKLKYCVKSIALNKKNCKIVLKLNGEYMKILYWTSIVLTILAIFLCFIPQQVYLGLKPGFSGYEKMLYNPKAEEELKKIEEEKRIREEKKKKDIESNIDSMIIIKEAKDEVIKFLDTYKSSNTEALSIMLDDPKKVTHPGKRNFIDELNYYIEYDFIKKYLKSNEYEVTKVNQLKDGFDISVTLKRYDLNKINIRFEEYKDNSEVYYEYMLFEDLIEEMKFFFEEELNKTTVPYSTDFINIEVKKINDKYKIVNNINLKDDLFGLKFEIDKNYIPKDISGADKDMINSSLRDEGVDFNNLPDMPKSEMAGIDFNELEDIDSSAVQNELDKNTSSENQIN